MPLNIACDAIDKAVKGSLEKGCNLAITFMGGEPLLEFELMRKICQYTWHKYPKNNLHFYSPTNGTVLDDEIRTWFMEHKEQITLCLSFDGYLSQNANRSESLSKVDFAFFHKLWPDQPLKMTISEADIGHLADNIIQLHEMKVSFVANCACGESEWSRESLEIFAHQMLTLVNYYADNSNCVPCELINVDLLSVLQPRQPMIRRCGLGDNYETVNFDGKKYPCHMFSPLALSCEKLGENRNKYNFADMTDFTVKGCESCLLNQACPKCYGTQYKIYGSPFRRDMNLCRCFKIQAKAAAIYNIKRLYRKGELSEADKKLLYAINLIMKGDCENHG